MTPQTTRAEIPCSIPCCPQARRPITQAETLTVGLISDTHDLLRPEAIAILQGCNHIIHAGDIGGARILKQLEKIAPVTAVRGNSDGGWAMRLPEFAELTLGGLRFYVIHSSSWADVDFAQAGYDVVVEGHTHRPEAITLDGVLFVNPGSAGPPRPGKPIVLAHLVIEDRKATPEFFELTDSPQD